MWWNKSKTTGKNTTKELPPQTPLAKAVRPQALMRALEQRIMFDGAIAASVGIDSHQNDSAAEAAHNETQSESPAPAVAASSSTDERKEIVFVDTRVPDYQSILNSISPTAEVVLLDTDSDGVQQIADALEGRSDVDAIHIISHGDQGVLLLGNGPLFEGNIASYSEQLQTIGEALTTEGDILLYGCEVGAGNEGQAFLSQLSVATGADIAASIDDTGGSAKGGDWELEITTGDVSQSYVLDTSSLNSYDNVLVTTSVNSVAGLKAAITTGNTDGVDDVITLTGNITFASAADAITINVSDGQTMSIVGGGFTLSGNNLARVLDVSTSGGSDVTISNLTISNGFVTGDGGNTPGDGVGLAGGDALGANIRNAGTLTITGSTITGGKAAGGGGGGGGAAGGGGAGGGGGGFGTTPGGAGGSNNGSAGGSGSAGTGGDGEGFGNLAGRGGTTTGGAGATYGNSYTDGGAGGTANNGSISIGGGGGGGGYNYGGGRGGNAAGGIYNTGILTVTTSSITNNIGAGGGGGGGGADGFSGNGGDAGSGIGAIWNAGGTVQIDSTTNTSLATGNVGAAGVAGSTLDAGNSNGAAGTATSQIRTTGGGTTVTNYDPNDNPTTSNISGDSVAWAGVGSTVSLDASGNANLADTELDALNTGNGDWADATLTVQRSGTAITSDVFGFNTSGALFTDTGSALQSGGQTFATYTNTNGVLTITFTSSGTTATSALVDNVAQRITYRNDTPAGDATISYVLADGDGGTATTATVTVTSDTIYVTNTTDTATVNVSNGVSFSEAVAIAAADATGSQTLIFSSGFAGQTATLAGNLAISESLTINADSASAVIISGSTITLGGGTTLSFTNGSGDTATISSTIAGTGGLAKSDAGTLTLSSTSNNGGWSGTMSVTGGTLTAGTGSNPASTLSSGTLTLDGGTLAMTITGAAGTTSTIANSVVLGAGGGTISVGGGSGANIANFTGVISGGNLTKSAAAILQLSGNNTYTGTTSIGAGTVIINHANALGTTAGDTTVSSGATVRLAGGLTVSEAFNITGTGTTISAATYGALHLGSGSNTISGTVTLSGNATISTSDTATLSGTISGANDLTKSGAGTLTLSGTNSYSGTTVSEGTLSVASDSNLGSGTVTLASGTTLAITGATTIDNAISLSGNATIDNSAAATLSGTISGANTLTKAGASTLTLSGTNSYSGTSVSAGTLSVASDSNLGSGSVALANGTTLAVTGATTIDNNIAITGTGTVSNSAAVTLSGVISGGNLTKAGASTLTLSGTNTYTGSTSVSAGTLSVGGDANLGADTINLANGTSLSITGSTTIDNALALTGVVTINAGAAATLSGTISSTGGLTKTGASTLTLSGTNTYSGATTVSAGTLLISGSTDSATTVASGGTLAGGGTIDGAVIVQNGGTLSPGSSPGTLTVNGNLTMNSGSTLAIEINGTTAGTQYDQIIVNGAVDVSNATLSVTHSYAPGQGDTYTIIDNDGVDAITGTFSGLSEGGTLTASGNSTVLTASYAAGDGNEFTLTAPINAAPTVGNLNGDNPTFTQGSGAILLDAGTNATVADGDSPDFNGGNVTVSIVTNGVAGEDVLAIQNQGTGAGQIGVSGSDVTYEGTVIGTFVGGTAGADLVITLDSDATPTAVQALVRNLTYNNTNATNNIDQSDRTVRVTVNDGDGGTSSNADITVEVVETVAPTVVSIVVDDTALRAGETSGVTITFSEAVTGLTTGDFTVANGALSSLSSSDGGTTWTATLTPDTSIEDATNVITLDNTAYTDIAGNAGTGTTDSNNYAIDTLRPSASIVVDDTALAAGETTTVTITFNEAVSGLTTADFLVDNGVLSGLSSSDGGITWTATLTPDTSVEDASNLITLDNTGYTDSAGNTGTSTTDSNNYAIDTLRPTATIVVSDTALAAGETSTVTITFNEAVTDLTTGDFTVGNGALSGLSSSDGGVTWTATLTPTSNTTNAINVITLDNTGVVDAAGNAGTSTTDSNNYDIDNEVPVNSLPSGQITDAITQLVFSSGNGNSISVADSNSLTVVISIGSGTLTANTGGTAGISNNGTGTVTITGTSAEINTALEGLTFTPNGAGSLTLAVQTTDALGNVDSDNLSVTVNTATLVVTSNLDTGADETIAGSYAADLADGGGLSIREALSWARAGDTITFDLDSGTLGNQGGTITLNGNQIQISYANITLDGDLNDDGAADVTISGNNASRVLVVGSSLAGVEITGMTLTQGTTGGGGGGLYIGNSSNVTLRDSNITNNTDTGGGGGGVFGTATTFTLINSTVSGNTSSTFGGGIRLVGGGSAYLNVLNSTITNNTTTGAASHGGGIQFGGNTATIVNTTVSGNAVTGAGAFGGGIRITSGTSNIYNSTIVGNASNSTGGGIHANGTDTLVNTVVAGNTSGGGATAGAAGSPLATGGSADDVGGTVETATNSYFGSTVTITTNNSSLNGQGTGSLLLGNLAYNNGGNIQTHRPQTGSALLEAGSNAALPVDTFDLDGDSNTAETLPVDANGDQRVSNIVDIGAVEGNAVPVLTGVDGGGTFVENTGAVVIDGNATVSDNDLDLLDSGNGDYDGASLVIVRNGGAVATDNFGFNDGNGISLSGSNLVKAGQTIASFDTSTAGQLTITFTNANGEIPTRANVDAILQQITYSSSSEDPGTSANLDITLNDGAGASVTETASLTILEVNDAPDVSATGGTPTFTENGSAVDLFSGVTIDAIESGQTITEMTLTVTNLADGSNEILGADGTSIALTDGNSGTTANNSLSYSVSVTGSTATVTLSIGGGISGSTAATIVDGLTYSNTSENPDTSTRTVTLTTVVDSGGTSNGGVDTTSVSISSSVSVTAVNDAPVISTSPASIVIDEDVAGAITGIVFSDVDAGSSSVTVTLSVPSGTLAATSGSGVTVGGTSSDLTLTGTVTDINAFIAASEVSFTTASNATSDVTLSVSIDDNGNTGSGGALTDSTTITLDVTAVNDAPVNSIPSAQNVDQDSTLTFSSGNSNLISISDVDAGSNVVEVTLTATNGLISLSGITGLTFTTGDGTSDATLTFSGSISDINTALDGLVFTPTGGYNGAASIEITTNDQGWSGSGGAQSDTDTINITVDPLNPEITNVASTTADGTYKLGDVITFTITFDQTVIVDTAGGSPTLLLETGASDRNATYVGGSGSNTLTFSYTVQAGDESADLDYQSTGALALNGSTIESGAGDSAIITLPATGGVDSIAGQHDLVIDGVIPTASIVVSDTALAAGETSTVTITFSEAVSGLTTGDFTVANGVLSGLSSSDGGITWTATLTPTTSIEDTTNAITLDNTGVVDAAGNTGSGTTDSNNYAIDTLRPTATIVVSDTALAVGETSTVTITFNEAVTGLTTGDFTVASGALSGLSSSDGGITWTATLTPTTSIEDTTNVITLDNTGVTDAAGNTGTGTTDSNNYAIDTTRPTASIVVSDTALAVGETSTVTITFSEAVSGLTTGDFTVANGALSGLSSSDGGITWTATLTPTTSIEDTANVITLDNTGVMDAAGNTGTGPTDSNNYAIDTLRPTATIVVSDTALNIGETSTVTITFNEAVTGLTTGDFSVANGALSGLSSSDGGITWTATLTPTASIEDTTNIITLDNTGVTDAAGNTGTGTTDSNNYAIDTEYPVVDVAMSDYSLTAGETATVTFTFSEAVTGFSNADITVPNGTLSAVTSSDGGITWTATFTPDANIEDASNIIDIDNTGYMDAAGNTGIITSGSINFTIDTLRPTASIVVSDTALAVGETSTVTITFSEAVTGLTAGDFSVANGALSGLSSGDGGITWTATLTPTTSIEDTTNIITLDNTGVMDAAGNTGTGTTDSNNYAIDSLRPTATIVVSDAALAVGETSTVTITFNEAVTGLTTADFTVDNGVLSGLSSSDGGITWTTTLTPTASIEDTTNIITLDNTGVTDAAGNTGTGTTDSNNYAIDTLRPTATIVVSDTALAVGETSTVTITFSEAVTGLTTGDFSVANGALSGLSSSDGGITWTATLTPTTSIEDTTNVITLDNTGVTDAAGNTGTGTTDSNNYAIDTLRPTASIVVSDTALAVGETTTVTITFNEAVSGLTTADFSVDNGVLSGLSSSDGGITWTATLTPSASIEDTTNIITLNNTGVMDAAGNSGTGTTDSNNYVIDTTRPTANIVLTNTQLPGGATALVTITFSEAVSGLTIADFNVDNGVLSGLSSNNGGITWTALLTPTPNTEDSTNVITLNNTGFTDGAGNTGIGVTTSNNYSIDNLRPTVSIVVNDTALIAGESSLVTITFSESITLFTISDLIVANGSLSNLTTSDGGITWTVILTPDTNISDTTNVITINDVGYSDNYLNPGFGNSSNNYAIDTLRPTASIVVSDTALAIGETTTVTITFNEAVTGLTTGDFTVANGALSGLSSSDGGITWTATLTPTTSIEDTSNLITLDNTGVTDAAGNTGSGSTDSNNYAIDTLRPTASIVVSDTALAVGETSTVTITFNEAVTGLTTGDFTVANGALSGLSSSDGGITWTATLTPTASIEDTTNVITLDNTSVTDAAGNSGTGTTDSNNYAIDTTRPTASIVVSDTALAAGETSTVTITFSEAVSGLTTGDFTVANGALSGLSSSDGGITWTATLTPTANITDTSNIITLDNTGVTDAAGNTGTGTTDSNNYAIDTLAPTVGSVSVPVGVHYNAGDVLSFTVNTSEVITVNTAGGTPRLALDVGGTTVYATYVAGSGTNTLVFQYTVQAGHNDANGISVSALENNGATLRDAAGNNLNLTLNNVGATNNVIVDTAAPTVSIVVNDAALAAGETSMVTITFNEAITGLEISDFTVANGVLSGLSSSDGGITWTATLTPTANTNDVTNIITLNNTGVMDTAGNAGTGTTDSNNYAIDTLAPTVGSVSVPVGVHYNAGDVLSFTVNTSEAVVVNTTGGTPRLALDIGGTTVFATYAAGSGTNTLVFQYTVQAGDNDANGISVDALENNGGTLRDVAGNNLNLTLNNVGATSNVIVDTTAPTTNSIVVADNSLVVGETTTVTITFSEAVTGLEISDFTVANGALSGLSSSDGGITWTATLTPAANTNDTSNVITLNNTGVVDAAGNTGTGNTTSNNYEVRTAITSNIPLFSAPTPAPLTPAALIPAPTLGGAPAPLIVLAPVNSGNPATGVLTTVEPPVLITATTPVITSPGMVINPPGLGSFSPVGLSTLSPTITLGDGPAANEPGSTSGGAGGRAAIGSNDRSPINTVNAPSFSGASSAFIDRGAMTSDISLQATPNMGQFTVQPGEAIYIAIPEGTFNANANTQLTVEVRQQNGAPLPSWLVFDPVTGTISGEAPDNFKGKLNIEVIVRDNKGNSASSVMTLSVGDQPLGLYELLNNSNQIALEQAGKPALENQFTRYGEVAREAEANALIHQLKTMSSANSRA